MACKSRLLVIGTQSTVGNRDVLASSARVHHHFHANPWCVRYYLAPPLGRGTGWTHLHTERQNMGRPRLLGRARMAVLGASVMLPAIAVGTGSSAIQASAGGTTR